MADHVAVTVTGTREVAAALDRIAAEAPDLRAAALAVADLLTPDVAARSRRRSGALAGSWSPGADPGVAHIRSGLPYAGPQEFGWPARGIAPTGAIARAIDANEGAITEAYARELEAVIDRAGLA